MSLQAISWALDFSQASGNDRLVVIVMCHHTDEEGFCGLSKATLADETHCSESTAARSQHALVELGEIAAATADEAPTWWLGIPANRRPRLYRMVGFLGSQYATPIRRRAGVSLGSRRGVTGVSQGSMTPQLTSTDATRSENREQRTENQLASPPKNETENAAEPTPPPWLEAGITHSEWARLEPSSAT